MKNIYTNKQLNEMLHSDEEVSKFRIESLEALRKQSSSYMRGFVLSAVLLVILYYTAVIAVIEHSNIPRTIISLCIFACLIGIYNMVRLGETAKKDMSFIFKATTPISETKRCSEILELIDTYVDAKQISNKAIQEGRQLYNFDADFICETVKDNAKSYSKQRELDACRKIHGLPV